MLVSLSIYWLFLFVLGPALWFGLAFSLCVHTHECAKWTKLEAIESVLCVNITFPGLFSFAVRVFQSKFGCFSPDWLSCYGSNLRHNEQTVIVNKIWILCLNKKNDVDEHPFYLSFLLALPTSLLGTSHDPCYQFCFSCFNAEMQKTH